MAIATLSVRLQAQIAEFQAEFKEAARSTEKFQENFQATATKASAYGNLIARGLEIGISAVSRLGEAALENASTIDDLSKKTGLSMRTIQEFQHVAGETGATVDQFANAAFRLGTNLSGGSKSVVAGVRELGLSFENLRAQSPDDQFRTIIKALEDMDDQQEANRIGVLLFGRTYKEVAVAVAEGYTDLADGARIMSDETVKRLADAEDAWKRWGRTTVIVSSEAISEVIKQFTNLQKFLGNVTFPGTFTDTPALTPEQIAFDKSFAEKARQQSIERIQQATKIADADEAGAKRSRAAVRSVIKEVETLIDVLKKTPDFELGLSSLPGFQIEIAPPDLSAYQGALKDQIELTQSNIPGIVIPPPTFEPLPPTFFQRAFGQEFGERLGFIIGDALTGGGVLNAVKNAASLIGSTLGKELANVLTTGKNALTGWLGGMVSTALPVIGSLLGPLVGKIGDLIQGAFGNRGRDAVKDFAASFGGFDALHARLLEMGVAGEALWVKLTQGVGRNNPEQAAAVIDEITRALDDFGTESERAATRVQAIGGAIDAINAKAVAFTTPFQNLLKDEEAEDVKAKLAAIGEVGQAEFERIGTFAAAAFAGLVQETGDAIGAIQQLGPTFQVLQDGVEKFGLTSTGTIDSLISMFALVNDAVTGPILQAIQTTGQIFEGLQAGGLLTADLFQTVATDIGSSFRDLEAKGGDVAKAMALSQPVLQKLWEAQQIYGDITDDTTSKILDQAEQQGLVGAHMKDVNQKILDVLLLIADVLGADIPDALRGLPQAAATAAQGIEREFSNIKISPITVDVEGRFNMDSEFFENERFRPLASGGIVRRPTLALIGEAGPEAVIPLNQLASVSPSSGESVVIFEIDGRQIAAATVPYLPGEARRYVPA